MNNQVWKYELNPFTTMVELPIDAEILSVQEQRGRACMWVLVDPLRPKTVRHFETYGTGHDIYYDMGIERKFIGTFQVEDGQYVFHVFERIN